MFSLQLVKTAARCVRCTSEKLSTTFRHHSSMGTKLPKNNFLTCRMAGFRSTQTHASEKAEDIKYDILEAALCHVNNHGWSEAALKLGIADLGLSEACLSMFSLGGVEIALHYDKTLNEELEDMMAQQQDDRLPGSEPPPIAHFLKDAIKTRLQLQVPYFDRWAEALSLVASPKVVPRAAEQFAHLIDDIWFYAGDESSDVTWYTRRATVAAVYRMTELFMIQDESPDFTETWAFLDRRLSELENMGENRLDFEKELENAGDLAKAAFIIARNMLSR